MAADAFQREKRGVVSGGKALQLVHGVDLAVLGADAVLDVGGQMVKIFSGSGIVSEQDVEVPVICSHRITPVLGCAGSGGAMSGKERLLRVRIEGAAARIHSSICPEKRITEKGNEKGSQIWRKMQEFVPETEL